MATGDGIAQRILYEDNHLIAIDKIPGEISQGDKTGDPAVGDAVAAFIKARDEKPGNVYLVPIHRLDRPVSGVILFAKTQKANSRMNALFRNELVEKQYWAIVANEPPAETGRLTHNLGRDRVHNKSIVYRYTRGDTKKAELDYRVEARSDRYILLSIVMRSGRHHQVRAQLAAVGCPIRGDLKYGYPRSNRDGSISLHARSVAFDHPVGKGPISIIAESPDETLWNALVHGRKN